ncbi:MAG: hypothetical protein RR290_00420 [Clostridia bacterium]
MEKSTLSLALGITDDRVKLGEAIIITGNMVKKMNELQILKKGSLVYFLEDVKNFRVKSIGEYANNIIKHSSNTSDIIGLLCSNECLDKGICFKNEYSNYKIEAKTYSYLYLKLWPKIAQIISKELENGKVDIKFYLKITEKTYKNFYPDLNSNKKKVGKLRDDIYIWMRYNVLGNIYSKYKIKITSENEILIPIEFRNL